MSGMDQFLAQHFGNTPDPEPTQEDVEKVAQAEMFLKLAAENGVDINNLTNAQVNELWQATWDQNQEKDAEFPPKKEEGKEHEDKESPQEEAVEEKAKKEHEEKKEGAAKFAEATDMGKIMAHSYVAELRKVAEAGGLDFLKESEHGDLAAKRGRALVRAAGKSGEAGKKGGEDLSFARGMHGGGSAEAAHVKPGKTPGAGAAVSRIGRKLVSTIKKNPKASLGAAAGTALAAGGAAGYLAGHRGKEKSSSANLDVIAANMALQKLAADGWDLEEGQALLQNLINEGPADSEKIAHVQDFDSAVDVRSSELLAEVGYPVDWSGTIFEKDAEHGDLAAARGRALVRAAGKSGEAGQRGGEDLSRAVGLHGGGSAEAAHVKSSKTPGVGAALSRAGRKVVSTIAKHPKASLGIGAGVGLAAGAAGGYAAGHKKEEQKAASAELTFDDLPPEERFDLAAGELALQKAAEAGWDEEQAFELLDAAMTLRAGNPTESEKVAQAQSEEQALDFRACELLELAGYTINW